MYLIEGNSFADVYRKSIKEILNNGEVVSPRGVKTYEIAPATIIIKDARKLFADPITRKGNYAFQLAELLWILRGSNNLDEIAHYNRFWRLFEDKENPGILNGAYGERIRGWNGVDQLLEVFHKLKKDPSSRQAVVMIFDPERDNHTFRSGNYSKDIPCTNYFNFQIRDGKLNMWTVMRSNDLHKGTLYDIPNFMTIQNILAGWLDVEVGKYTHSAASFHIYESDVENLKEVYEEDCFDPYTNNEDFGDPRISLLEFNIYMYKMSQLETFTREGAKEQIKDKLKDIFKDIEVVENSWWRSVIALICLYNYRKSGATKDEFSVFLPYITNEYKAYAQTLDTIKR